MPLRPTTTRQTPRLAIAGVVLLSAAGLLAGCSSNSSQPSSDPTAVPSFSAGGVQGGGTLPSDWPSDVPTPTQIPLKQAVSIGGGMNASFSGPGDLVAIQKDLAQRFKANGFTTSNEFGGGGSAGSVTVYEKPGLKVQVTAVSEGGNAVVSEGVYFVKGNPSN